MSSESCIDNTTENWRLVGQELVNFVYKSTESLHNVVNKAKISSNQRLNGKRNSSFKRKQNMKKNPSKKRIDLKNLLNEKTVSSHKSDQNLNKNHLILNSSNDSTELHFDYELETTSSSCEELYEIPMEDLLSSPTWKLIVEQNSFIWP